MAPEHNSDQAQAPIVIKQGGNGLGVVLAAMILVGGAVYVVNVMTAQQRQAPASAEQLIQDGANALKGSAQEGMNSLKDKLEQKMPR
mgnify:CR=1 FL=1